MYRFLTGMRVVEASSFIASPYAGLMLAQLGADVVRIDPIGGGPDFRRWPVSEGGDSFYWEALNKGKRSIAINLFDPEGRELAQALAGDPSGEGGVLVTNYPVDGFMSYEKLVKLRPNLICARVMGWADGTQAVDYTINAQVGVPYMTGASDRPRDPVNHVLPAWDLLAGATAALSVLAAVQHRQATGVGQEIRIPLSDLAAATMANLGQVAEVLIGGTDRPKSGNTLFGAFGRDFATRDREEIMVVGLTSKQWASIVKALGIGAQIAQIETRLGLRLGDDAGMRYLHRLELEPLVERAISEVDWPVLQPVFDGAGVCYGQYRTLRQAATEDRIFTDNPIFSAIANPSGFTYPAPGYPASFGAAARERPIAAPRLGEHTAEILADVLGLSEHAIGSLIERNVVAAP